jgi:hypothetical protein
MVALAVCAVVLSCWKYPCCLSSAVSWLKNVSYPCNRSWRPVGLWDIKASAFSRQLAHRWWWGCQPYAPATLYRSGRFLVPISARGWVNHRAIVCLEGLGQLKNPVTSLGMEPMIFQLVAQCLSQVCHCMTCLWFKIIKDSDSARILLYD